MSTHVSSLEAARVVGLPGDMLDPDDSCLLPAVLSWSELVVILLKSVEFDELLPWIIALDILRYLISSTWLGEASLHRTFP